MNVFIRVTLCAFIVSSSFLTAFSQSKKEQQVDQNKAHFSAEDKTNLPEVKGVFFALLNDGTGFAIKSISDLEGKEKIVKEISIQRQELTSVPKELSYLRALEVIDLSNNSIQDFDPAFFKKFPKLKRLYLNNNPISKEKLQQFAEQNPAIQIFFLPEHFTK